MVTNYQAKIENLDREVAQILQEAKHQGEKERKAILERAEKMAQKIVEDAKLQAEREREKIEEALKNETLKSAAEKAMELLKSKISEKDHKTFISEFIKGAEEFHG
jgi:F-type H+-transporting ATPase subunit b